MANQEADNLKGKISIIGGGNVGSHLHKAFTAAGYTVDLLSGRDFNVETAESLCKSSSNAGGNIIVICVKDDAISRIANMLKEYPGIVLHTSGSQGISVLADAGIQKYGVLYPLQSFSKEKEMDYAEIPFLIEASDEDVYREVYALASSVSERVNRADSTTRRHLHIAAVFACNFVNHLWALSDEYLKSVDLDFELLLPLIKNTVKKITVSSPADVQTGPASRGDAEILASHLSELSQRPEMESIYRLLSDSIMKKYVKNRL